MRKFIFILVLFFLVPNITLAQGPTPIGVPLNNGPAPVYGQQLNNGPAPVIAPNPPIIISAPQPTQDPLVFRQYVQALTPLYEYNRYTGIFGLFVPFTLTHVGDVITIRVKDAYWAQALDGWYAGLYLERWALRNVPQGR